MTINSKHIRVQNGTVRNYVKEIRFHIGTPAPTPDGLKPKDKITISWDRALLPSDIDLKKDFYFEIVTEENIRVVGKGFMSFMRETHESEGWVLIGRCPIMVYEHEVIFPNGDL